MNRLLRCVCLCSASPLLLSACGDDEGDTSNAMGDGGVSLQDQVDQLGDQLGDLNDDLDGLDGKLGVVDKKVGDLDKKVDDSDKKIDDRVAALEDPEPESCSAAESCIPDGIDLVNNGIADIISRICQLELNCCDEDELRYKFGPGITDADECVAAFKGLVNNGFIPEFLTAAELGGGYLSYGNDWLVRNVVTIAQALNNPAIEIEINGDAVEECVKALEERECSKYVEPEEGEIPDPECSAEVPEIEEIACDPARLIRGLKEEGELCGLTSLPECADGLICRLTSYSCEGPNCETGICVSPAEAGDPCTRDAECDPQATDLFCNRSENECQERAGEGDDCAYVNLEARPGYQSDMFPGFDEGGPLPLQNPAALAIECKRGLSCDPDTNTCVAPCNDGFLCYAGSPSYFTCPDGSTCNVTENPDLAAWQLGTCRPALQQDDPCTADWECESNRCGVDDTCSPVLKEDGEDCELAVADQAQFDSTCASGYCAADGTCATRCNEQIDCEATYFCDFGLYIDEINPAGAYACAPKKANTVACNAGYESSDPSMNYECTSGFCDQQTGLCADKVAAGGSCTQNTACPAGQFCSAGTCTDMAGEGETCGGVVVCEWDLACATVDAAPSCQKPGEFPVDASCGTSYVVGGVSYYGDGLCESGWCAGLTTCAEPIEEGEECDTAVLTKSRCAAGLYCDHPVDDTTGECTAQHTVGQDCNPRFNGLDCLNTLSANGSSCVNRSDTFVCSYSAIESETLFCDGE